MMRIALLVLVALIAGCASQPLQGPEPPGPQAPEQQTRIPPGSSERVVIRREGPAPRSERDRPPDAGTIPADVAFTPDAVPRPDPKSRYGNPDSYSVFGKRYYVLPDAAGYRERGGASWYGEKFHGRRTSSGETYDMFAMTAAHKTLPLPSYVRVTHLVNGRSVVVRVNDRGPFHDDRIIDLSYAAAARLDIVDEGHARVEVHALTPAAMHASTAAPRRYLVAGAASPDPVAAVQLREQLRALGVQDVTIHMVHADDGTARHEVRIGPLRDSHEARTLSDWLADRAIATRLLPSDG